VNDELKKLKGLVFHPEWDNLLVYIVNKLASEHERLENCSPDGLKFIQGKISVYKDILTLRDDVKSIMK